MQNGIYYISVIISVTSLSPLQQQQQQPSFTSINYNSITNRTRSSDNVRGATQCRCSVSSAGVR
jgi:hypothetical protein